MPGAMTGADNFPINSPRANGTPTDTSAISPTAPRLRPVFRWPNSKSAPIWNISRVRPIWLIMVMAGAAVVPNSAADTPGKKCPSNEGPSIRPAMISPMTPGWPRARNTVFIARAAAIIRISCSRMKDRAPSV